MNRVFYKTSGYPRMYQPICDDFHSLRIQTLNMCPYLWLKAVSFINRIYLFTFFNVTYASRCRQCVASFYTLKELVFLGPSTNPCPKELHYQTGLVGIEPHILSRCFSHRYLKYFFITILWLELSESVKASLSSLTDYNIVFHRFRKIESVFVGY